MKDKREKMIEKLIINLYIPINTILTCNKEVRKHLNLPEFTINDIKIIQEMEKSFVPCDKYEINQREVVVDTNFCIRKVKSLSFYQYLLDRLIN